MSGMTKRRIVLAAEIVASGVFASFYGGTAIIFFVAMLFIPLVSLVYTVYVYLRFRIYQSVESKIIVKGEKVPYHFTLSDEDFVSYANVKVEFLDDFSTVQDKELSQSYYLIPDEKNEKHTEILCRYRGEYNIGIKSVIVTDFLGIMEIKYPAPSTISMSVLPKVITAEKIDLAPIDSDAKLLRFSKGVNEPPDSKSRKYIAGDSMRLINWKISAKKNELFTRQSSEIQNNEITFILDLSPISDDDYIRIITEDKIVESVLTIADYLVKKRIPLNIIGDMNGIEHERINNSADLKEFYLKCASMKFASAYQPADIFSTLPKSTVSGSFVIFAVSRLTEELCKTCESIIGLDGDCAVLLMGSMGCEYSDILDKRVIYRQVNLNEEVSGILGGANGH